MAHIDATSKQPALSEEHAPSLSGHSGITCCSCSICDQKQAQVVKELKASLMNLGIGPQHLFHFAETDSTNSRAHELAREGYPEGTLVIADAQTAGRGQFGRTWHSPVGKGTYLSLILRPQTSPARMPGITLMTAVCLAEAFKESYGIDSCIKWPNDILVRGRKLSGILTEMATTGGALDYIIVGVGINLYHSMDDFPEEIREKATSILMEKGSCHGRALVIRAFLARFEKAYRVFVEKGVESIVRRWSDLSGMNGRHVLFETAGTVLEGRVSGIHEDGSLMVHCTDGRERRFLSGHITFPEQT